MKTVVVRKAKDAKPDLIRNAQHVLVIEDTINPLISIASRLMDRALDTKLTQHGSSFGQWPILMNLWAEEGLSQKELSRLVRIEEGTTTRTLDRMEAEGLIRRERDARDRRQQNIFLTEKGRRLRDTLVPQALSIVDLSTKALTKAELVNLRAILRKMIASLTEGLEADNAASEAKQKRAQAG